MLFNTTMFNRFDEHAKNSGKNRKKMTEVRSALVSAQGNGNAVFLFIYAIKFPKIFCTVWLLGKKLVQNYITNAKATKLLWKC